MTYEVSLVSSRLAAARIKGDTLWITPKVAGIPTLMLTADDGNTGRKSLSQLLTVTQNHAPEIKGLMNDITLIPSDDPVVINLADYTSDPENDPFEFDVQISENGIVHAAVEGDMLTITPIRHGNVELQITASDLYSAQTSTTIFVTVEQKYAPKTADQLLLYPNPTNGTLWYSYILTEPASIVIRVINSIGQIMFQTPAEKQSSGTSYYQIDLHDWGAGMYFVQYIKDGKIVDIKNVVKQ